MTPKTAALRYRIWAYASQREWDVTFKEVAQALGVTAQMVGTVARGAGWIDRFRAAERTAVDNWSADASAFGAGNHLARDIVAGRVGVDA